MILVGGFVICVEIFLDTYMIPDNDITSSFETNF